MLIVKHIKHNMFLHPIFEKNFALIISFLLALVPQQCEPLISCEIEASVTKTKTSLLIFSSSFNSFSKMVKVNDLNTVIFWCPLFGQVCIVSKVPPNKGTQF